MWELIVAFLRKKLCIHEWEEIKEICKYESSSSTRPYQRIYVYKCTKCGKFKQIVIK
jgi:hypothetical protein